MKLASTRNCLDGARDLPGAVEGVGQSQQRVQRGGIVRERLLVACNGIVELSLVQQRLRKIDVGLGEAWTASKCGLEATARGREATKLAQCGAEVVQAVGVGRTEAQPAVAGLLGFT